MIAEITISDVTSIIAAIVAGVVAIIGSLVGGVVTIRNSQRAAEKDRQQKQDSNDKKLDEIHELTNSNLSSVKKELAELRALVDKNASAGVVTKSPPI
jgi:hypothetical protein